MATLNLIVSASASPGWPCAASRARTGCSRRPWQALLTALLLATLPAVLRVAAQEAQPLKVMTLNVAAKDNLAPLNAELQSRSLDDSGIYLLQEVTGETPTSSKAIQALLPLANYEAVFRGATELSPGRWDGLAILSRYPLRDVRMLPLPANNFRFRNRGRIALIAIAETPVGDVLVANTHLDSRINLPARLRQLEPVLREVEASALPAIIGGDLNTNPHRWLFHLVPVPYSQLQSRGLQQHMEERGLQSVVKEWKPTHDWLSMRLDWIFVRHLIPASTRVEPLKHSDHHAVLCTVLPKRASTH